MKIGIIGCGYVGSAAARFWREKGHQISVTTRQANRIHELQQFAQQVVDLNQTSLSDFISNQEVILISVAPDRGSNYFSTYLQTAIQVFEAAVQAQTLCQILYTSSTSVYGDYGGEWVNEETPLKNINENIQILMRTEEILLKCSSEKLKVCVLRLGEIYGPGREIEKRLRRMQHDFFPGTGNAYTNLIHLEDIVSALDFSCSRALNGVYNLCNDFHITRRQFYEELCRKENLPNVTWDPSRISMHQGNKRVSNEKIKKLGFIFKHPSYELRNLL